MLLASLAILIGLPVLLWSAGKFVGGAASVANHFGVSPLLIGMLIIGFGTSAPEIIVSVFAAIQGNSGIALGNAYGSNIANILLILGLTAIISPIAVKSEIIKKELPVLLGITFFAAWQVWDLNISKDDAFSLLGLFVLLLSWSIYHGMKGDKDALADEYDEEINSNEGTVKTHVMWLIAGLLLLVASSRMLVWGAVEVATFFGVSDTIIGLTVIAIGTSLPELASSLMAVKKGEHDLAIGNVIGSNMFNTLAVVGIAGTIQPMTVGSEFLYRDVMVMFASTIALFIFCIGIKRQGRLNRLEGGAFVLAYAAYTYWLIQAAFI
ncbi:calcium/sodium antiporter [Alteromonas macleodii]|jgi:cation:H+ antiporter|uniref:CACA family Na+/Ca+ antiporter n=1 Tax=Alteromonas macleodii (strain English Channel 673) TaxID=1004788 RepID=A0AB32ZWP0_ALTME|nr:MULTISPECIES: calcium/sodium antiporter [Alteromonas]MEC7134464.1 calcium/sodium antiporter [Pseudomonadota bacterium]PTU01378.1 calcium/sodium antiporter [Pseudomonas sp. HMWF031]RUM29916.1 MAG: calcium/sodium antiporter [Alteromonas sp.]AFT73957.1 CACA family Na+/Ca+ antiporter [Alteromonas macleodii str. 'English Channel 673']AFT94783.1 CACA family Na+/Ca+ antiporter [Alteromonas macleodii str. 'Balearic Sea AD45']|tara:strand:+ start:1156 stop:2124 length:969 start_codon:yes stop_codon:yes gene_type:complete